MRTRSGHRSRRVRPVDGAFVTSLDPGYHARPPMAQSDAKQFSWQVPGVEREELEVDVLIVGAGPASLACAIDLKRRCDAAKLEKTILVLEKAEEVGYHILSGAVMDPRGMQELFPAGLEGGGWKERGCPVESPVVDDCMDVLWQGGRWSRLKGFLVPPTLHNHGNSIISLRSASGK